MFFADRAPRLALLVRWGFALAMLLVLTLAGANVTICTIAGIAVLILTRVQAWRHLRPLLFACVIGATYSVVDVALTAAPLGAAIPVLVGLNTFVAAASTVSWSAFTSTVLGQRMSAWDRALVAAALLAGAASLVPGLVYAREPFVFEAAFGLRYHAVASTRLAGPVLILVIAPLASAVVRLARGARRGVSGARVYAVALSIFLVSAINEALVAMQIYRGVFLAELGFLAIIAGIAFVVAQRVTEDAGKLEVLSASLGKIVSRRTEELGRMREMLEHSERLALLGRLAASVGHEINNPLSYVMANVQVAKEDASATGAKDIAEALEEAMDGAVRIRGIVADLRTLGRSDDGGLDPGCEVKRSVDDALRMTQGRLEPRVRVEVDVADSCRAALSAQRLVQVLINLLQNAAQAMPADTHQGLIQLSARVEADGFVCIEVRDNGKGMSAATRARLFEPFFTTKPIGQGTGLGLFITSGIVRGAGGEITVDSEEGRGTTVRLRLPACEPDTRPDSERRSARTSVGMRVLVVDDDALVGRGVCRALRCYEAEVVTSAKAALARLESGASYDVVLCDLMMPEMTGVELYRRVSSKWPKLADRFLFLTGGASTAETAAFVAENQTRTLYKPVEREVLTRRITELLANDRTLE